MRTLTEILDCNDYKYMLLLEKQIAEKDARIKNMMNEYIEATHDTAVKHERQLAEINALIARLEGVLHSKCMHPDYEYEETHGDRKAFDEAPPEGEGWQRNIHMGSDGWERFDYHEEAYWMRKLTKKGSEG